MTEEKKVGELVHAWNIVKQAAENSSGSLSYHSRLQQAVNIVANALQQVVDNMEKPQVDIRDQI